MNKIGNAIKTALTSIGTKIKSFFTNIRDKIKSWSENIKNKFKNRGSKNSNVSNSSIQTQKDNSNVQTKDNNVFEPQENTYIYKPKVNSIDNNIDADEPKQNQPIKSNEDNQATSFQTEKIQNIKINEEAGSVEYTTVDGNNYTVDINKVLDNKKGIYKDFSISKKCKDLTGSFIKGRRLEKSLNPLVINGLNNDEDIDKYINCVNNEEKLFFDLEHNTQNSKLGFFEKNNMKKIAEIEQKLGADVQIEPGFFSKIKTQFTEIFKKEDTEKESEEKMIAKQYKEAVKMLKDKAINSLYESAEYASIEANLEKCANWYMNNGNFKRADKCIDLLSNMVKDKHKNYYLPKYDEEVKKGNQEYATERYAQEDSIKRYNIQKLRIKRNWLSGKHDKARELYSRLINDLGIDLTQEEYEKSIQHDGLLNGTYSKLIEEKIQNPDGTYTTNSYFKDIPIVGNERALAILEQIRNNKQNPVVINVPEPDKEPQEGEENGKQEGNEQEVSNKQQNIEEQEKSESEGSNQITKEKINELISKYDKLDNNKKYKKGLATTYIMVLADYLKETDDKEVQFKLEHELSKIQNLVEQYNREHTLLYKKINVKILEVLSELYEEGRKSADGNRRIISEDNNKYGYYMYLTNRGVLEYQDEISEQQNKEEEIENFQKIIEQAKKDGDKEKAEIYEKQLKIRKYQYEEFKKCKKMWIITNEQMKKIQEEFTKNEKEIVYEYVNFIKEKKDLKKDGIETLIAETRFIQELDVAKSNSEYLTIFKLRELFSRVNSKKNQEEMQQAISSFLGKIKNGEKVDYRTLELLGDIYYTGIKRNGFDELFVKPNKILAEKVYSRLLEENKDIENSDIYNRLLNLYDDNTLPIYNPSKVKQLEGVMKQKGIAVHQQGVKENKAETKPYTYVCSDIHGQYGIYQAVINRLKDNDKLYILGDVIDRGPDGIKILQDIKERQKNGQVEFFIGNHEYMMIKSLFYNDLMEKQIWTKESNGGSITANDYEALSQEEQQEIREFLLNSLVYKGINIEDRKIYLVHAKALEEYEDKSKTFIDMIQNGKEKELYKALWYRAGSDCDVKEISKKGEFTIVGHTPQDDGISYSDYGILYIDCGAAYNDKGALIRLEDGKVMYFDSDVEREKLIAKESEQR